MPKGKGTYGSTRGRPKKKKKGKKSAGLLYGPLTEKDRKIKKLKKKLLS